MNTETKSDAGKIFDAVREAPKQILTLQGETWKNLGFPDKRSFWNTVERLVAQSYLEGLHEHDNLPYSHVSFPTSVT